MKQWNCLLDVNPLSNCSGLVYVCSGIRPNNFTGETQFQYWKSFGWNSHLHFGLIDSDIWISISWKRRSKKHLFELLHPVIAICQIYYNLTCLIWRFSHYFPTVVTCWGELWILLITNQSHIQSWSVSGFLTVNSWCRSEPNLKSYLCQEGYVLPVIACLSVCLFFAEFCKNPPGWFSRNLKGD